jgi:hypothetical protein
MAEQRLALIEQELHALNSTRDQLQRLIETCATGSDADCLELTPPS